MLFCCRMVLATLNAGAGDEMAKHKHLVTLDVPCSIMGTLVALVEYHERSKQVLTVEDVVIDALARGLSEMMMEARAGPRQVLTQPDPTDMNVQ